MKIKQRIKGNIKSQAGFTMMDLIIALSMFTLFVGLIGSLFYSSYKTNLQTRLSGAAVYYTIEVLEDIDKIPYEEVKEGMESKYDKLIPEGFDLSLEVSNYNKENENLDLLKIVKLKLSYKFADENMDIVIYKLKVKEIA